VTAAAPSLHTAYPLICLVAAIRARLPKAVASVLAINFLGVVFTIIYLGEHYVFDVLAGAAYAAVTLWLVSRALAADADRRSPPAAAVSATS
jgi:membrane-associated phospholipid phosphatase